MQTHMTTRSPVCAAHAPRPAFLARQRGGFLAKLGIALAVLVLLLFGIALTALRTEWGARQVWQQAARFLPGRLSGEFAGGTLAEGIALRNVVYRDEGKVVKVDKLAGRWRLSHTPWTLSIASFDIGNTDVTLLPTPPKPATLPARIHLPLAVDLRRATVQRLAVHKDAQTAIIDGIGLRARSDGEHHEIDLDRAKTPLGNLRALLRLNGTRPFDIGGNIALDGSLRDQAYRAFATLSGSLETLGVRLDAAAQNAAARADIIATPFAQVPLRSARIKLDHLDPNVFNSAWPKAALAVRATLSPVGGKGSDLVISGPVSVENGAPGTIDQGRLPLRSAQADVRLDARKRRLSQMKVLLEGKGILEGGGELGSDGKGAFTVNAQGLDLHALHGALRPTRLSGPVALNLHGDAQDVKLRLADPAFSVLADASLTPQRIALHGARIEAGRARLELGGVYARQEPSAYSFKGSLRDFNPSVFFATVPQAKSGNGKRSRIEDIDARINLDFDAAGTLRPEPGATIRFDVRDSRYAGLPMTGGGIVRFAGKRVLPSDARLTIAGNSASVKGSFGAPSDRLRVDIDAPALARLGFGLSGMLQVQSEVGGTPQRPVADARYTARNLAAGENRLDSLSGEAHLRGVPGFAPDARLELDAAARGLRSGDLRLAAANARVAGTDAAHTIRLNADGSMAGARLDLDLAARGSLHQGMRGMAWEGTIDTLENRGLPRIATAAPLSLSVAPGMLDIGAGRLSVAQAAIDLKGFQYRDGAIRSEGAVNGLDIGYLLSLRRRLTGSEPPVKTDLILDGQWNIALTDRADGFIRLQRRGGDVYIGSAAGNTALGLGPVSLRADLQGNAAVLAAQAEARRIGRFDGQGRIGLQPQEGRIGIAPDAPISGRLSASIPQLGSIAALAGPRIGLEGSARAELVADGTLAEPGLSGSIEGDRLALTLYDQGVRLRDGIARIAIVDGIAELRDVVFHGGSGTLRATGRIPLNRPNPAVSASIVADHLQLLASPSGRLTVSGQASVANVNDRLQIAGKFGVDSAQFSLPEKSAPALGDDVVVIRSGQPQPDRRTDRAEARRAGPFAPYATIQVDLGDDFRFKGSGADMRLTGTVTVETAPGEQLQARGTVRIAEGSYEAFGTKLAIEHGILNFQGPAQNPNLNILAMRRDREVAAGVQVTGTARQPRVQLVSEPKVSEEEKLSWLIFGRAGAATQPGQAQSAAKGAALGLLNRLGGQRVAKGLGLDQLSIGESEFGLAGQQVVSVGKEIANRLFIGYEQSLAGAESVLKLTYELTRNWTVVLRGGAVTGLDMSYNKRFDAIRW